MDNGIVFRAIGELDKLPSSVRAEYETTRAMSEKKAYPLRINAEILSAALLHRLDATCTDPRHREHVTIAVWDEGAPWRKAAPLAPPALAHPALRFDVDEPGHLAALEALAQRQGLGLNSSAAEVVAARLKDAVAA